LLTLTVPAAARGASHTPPPPDFERCHGSGNQTICSGNRVMDAVFEPTGILCGSGAEAFEIWDDGGTVSQQAIRWYDADGNLTQRMIKNTWFGSAWINPETGARVPYRQTNHIVDVLATPGDVGSATNTTTGVVNFIVPGQGAIVPNAGRTVFSFDGTLEFSSGPQAILDYFLDGDTAALEPICEALRG